MLFELCAMYPKHEIIFRMKPKTSMLEKAVLSNTEQVARRGSFVATCGSGSRWHDVLCLIILILILILILIFVIIILLALADLLTKLLEPFLRLISTIPSLAHALEHTLSAFLFSSSS
jgi:hypothetical protein